MSRISSIYSAFFIAHTIYCTPTPVTKLMHNSEKAGICQGHPRWGVLPFFWDAGEIWEKGPGKAFTPCSLPEEETPFKPCRPSPGF